jgi:DUF1365 family protein
MAWFGLSSHSLGNLDRHQGVVWFAFGCKHVYGLPVEDKAHLLILVRRKRRFAQLPFKSLQDLMCSRDVYVLALFVHECMTIVATT